MTEASRNSGVEQAHILLGLLESVERDGAQSQRRLASELGIALGLVNGFGVAVYPHLCEVRADRARLTARFRESLRTLGAIVVPLVLLQVALAPLYVPIVFGPRWVAAEPVLMLVCLSALPRPFAAATSQLLKAVGRPDIELRWQAALTALLVPALALGTGAGLTGVAAAVLVVQAAVLTAYCLRAPRPFVAAKADLPPGTTTEVLTDPGRFLALAPEWDALWASVPGAYASQGFGWSLAGWRTTARPRGRRPHIVTMRQDGRLVLVWPLTLHRSGLCTIAAVHSVVVDVGYHFFTVDPRPIGPICRATRLIRHNVGDHHGICAAPRRRSAGTHRRRGRHVVGDGTEGNSVHHGVSML